MSPRNAARCRRWNGTCWYMVVPFYMCSISLVFFFTSFVFFSLFSDHYSALQYRPILQAVSIAYVEYFVSSEDDYSSTIIPSKLERCLTS